MKKSRFILCVLLLLIIGGNYAVFAQSEKLQAMEEELVFIKNTANRMWLNKSNANYDYDNYFEQNIDIIDLLCKQFDNMLNQMLVEDKDMTYPFTELLREAEYYELLKTHAVWSADSLLRIFSWELPGGTMHFYGNAIQYKNANSLVRSFSFDNKYNRDYDVQTQGSAYDIVYVLIDKNKIIYILSGSAIGSTRTVCYDLIAFGIQEEFVAKNIFENKNGNYTNKTSVDYDIGCSEIEGGDFPRPIIDEDGKTMDLLEVSNGCFTGKFMKYKFDDEKFKLMKIIK